MKSSGGKDVPPSPACLPVYLSACRLCQHRSLFIVRSLAVLTLMPAADPIPSGAPPSLSVSISAAAAFFLCLSVSSLTWLGSDTVAAAVGDN